MTSFCPTFITEFLLKLLAHKRVFRDMPNLSAIPLRLSPATTSYSVISFCASDSGSPNIDPKTCGVTATGGENPTIVFSWIKLSSGDSGWKLLDSTKFFCKAVSEEIIAPAILSEDCQEATFRSKAAKTNKRAENSPMHLRGSLEQSLTLLTIAPFALSNESLSKVGILKNIKNYPFILGYPPKAFKSSLSVDKQEKTLGSKM